MVEFSESRSPDRKGGTLSSNDFEVEKWRGDVEIRQLELRLKEQELNLKVREQDRLTAESKRSRWGNPLFLGIAAAAIAAAGGGLASWLNGISAQRTEAFKAESARILEAIKASDPEKAKENLRFLIATGLVSASTADRIQEYISKQSEGKGAYLPSSIEFDPVRFRKEIDALPGLENMTKRTTGNSGASVETPPKQ